MPCPRYFIDYRNGFTAVRDWQKIPDRRASQRDLFTDDESIVQYWRGYKKSPCKCCGHKDTNFQHRAEDREAAESLCKKLNTTDSQSASTPDPETD